MLSYTAKAKALEKALQPAAGMSPRKDAWRRLRRDRVAMASLVALVAICLIAFFAPLLPLQPPDDVDTTINYQAPKFSPLFEKSLHLDWQAIESTPERLAKTQSELDEAVARLDA